MKAKSTASLQDTPGYAGESGRRPASIPLRKWLWRSYLRSAIVPLLFIEITFLAIYWISNSLVYQENIATVSKLSDEFMADVAIREATAISNEFSGISAATDLFARQSLKALKGNYDPPASEKQRYARNPAGAFYTRTDNGTTASYYSGIVPIGDEQVRKVWKLSALDPVMIDIKNSNPLVASLYFNTFDSYNRIYPFFSSPEQYPAKMNIPSYNFYYEADATHNPSRKPVWTDAYIDPAGHGWMVSSIAPVWNGEKLEGVVGLDVTLDTVIRNLMQLKLPWNAYAILIDREGRIVAMPPKGEEDFGVKELTAHTYSKAILSDTFKPDAFNVFKRADTRPLADALRKNRRGTLDLTFGTPHKVSFATIAGPEWRLVIIAPTDAIRADANQLRSRLETVGLVMIAGLLVFYVGFFIFLYGRAKAMSRRVAAPLAEISSLIRKIGMGDYRQQFAGSEVSELNELGQRLAQTGHQLGDAQQRITEQERLLSRALVRQQQLNEEQVRFVRMISHEVRTPLSVIDSAAQVISRKAETLSPADLQTRAAKLRKAVQRISGLLHKLVESSVTETDVAFGGIWGGSEKQDGRDEDAGYKSMQLQLLVIESARSMVVPERLRLDIQDIEAVTPDSATIAIALRTVLDNAVLYSEPDTPITVALAVADGVASISVSDHGPGIAEQEIPEIGKRYFRGGATTGKEGAGIGIFVARKLLERIEGRLELASDSGGTVATILVPLGLPADDVDAQ